MGPLPNPDVDKRILNVLTHEPHGLNIKEISEKSNTTRITATKHLERLVKEEKLFEIFRSKMRIFVLIDEKPQNPEQTPINTGYAGPTNSGEKACLKMT